MQNALKTKLHGERKKNPKTNKQYFSERTNLSAWGVGWWLKAKANNSSIINWLQSLKLDQYYSWQGKYDDFNKLMIKWLTFETGWRIGCFCCPPPPPPPTPRVWNYNRTRERLRINRYKTKWRIIVRTHECRNKRLWGDPRWLTIVTLALRRSRFSSCRHLHFSLSVSSSIFSTLFSCCRDARRFVSSSSRNAEMNTPCLPSRAAAGAAAAVEEEDESGVAELLLPAPSVSLSLALSAMTAPRALSARSTARERQRKESPASCLTIGSCPRHLDQDWFTFSRFLSHHYSGFVPWARWEILPPPPPRPLRKNDREYLLKM